MHVARKVLVYVTLAIAIFLQTDYQWVSQEESSLQASVLWLTASYTLSGPVRPERE